MFPLTFSTTMDGWFGFLTSSSTLCVITGHSDRYVVIHMMAFTYISLVADDFVNIFIFCVHLSSIHLLQWNACYDFCPFSNWMVCLYLFSFRDKVSLYTLAALELSLSLSLKIRMSLNSQRSTCLGLLGAGIKGVPKLPGYKDNLNTFQCYPASSFIRNMTVIYNLYKLHVSTQSLSTVPSTVMLCQWCNIKQDENIALTAQNKEMFVYYTACPGQRLLQWRD